MPKLFIAGDSTAAPKLEQKRPESGWGEYLHLFMSPLIEIKNYAENGRSTKSFISDGLLEKIDHEIKAGDYLVIQFGHNDEKTEDPKRYTDPGSEYQDNLLRMARVAIKHQATPILITSITRRLFIDHQLKNDTIGLYPRMMLACADRENIHVIDAYHMTWDLLFRLGEEKSKDIFLHLAPRTYETYPDGLTDNTHLSPYGAKLIASLIALELNKII